MKVILQGRVLITNQQKHWFFSLNFDLCLRKLLLVKVFQYVSSCSWTFEETVRTGDIIANTWLIGHRQTHHLLCSTVHLFYSCKREKIGAINFKEIFSKRYTHHNDETQAWTCSARFKKKTRVSQAQNERRVAHPSMVLLAHYHHKAQSSMFEPDSESGKYIIQLHHVEFGRNPSNCKVSKV